MVEREIELPPPLSLCSLSILPEQCSLLALPSEFKISLCWPLEKAHCSLAENNDGETRGGNFFKKGIYLRISS